MAAARWTPRAKVACPVWGLDGQVDAEGQLGTDLMEKASCNKDEAGTMPVQQKRVDSEHGKFT